MKGELCHCTVCKKCKNRVYAAKKRKGTLDPFVKKGRIRDRERASRRLEVVSRKLVDEVLYDWRVVPDNL